MGSGNRWMVQVSNRQRNAARRLDQLTQVVGVTHHAHDRLVIAEHHALMGEIEDVLHRPGGYLSST